MKERYSKSAQSQAPSAAPASLREQQAEVTKQAILDAARRLFRDEGYARTTVRMLADAAGVAVQTIYSTFGSKPGVLAALVDVSAQAAGVGALRSTLMTATDPVELLLAAARFQRVVREDAGDVIRTLRQAAESDPEIKAVHDRGWEGHRMGMESICRRLGDGGDLRAGLTVETATATALALTSFEAYEETVGRRSWSHDQYEQWLVDALAGALLAPTPLRRFSARRR